MTNTYKLCWVIVKASRTPNLALDAAGVVDNSHTGGVGSNIKTLDDLSQEDLDLLKL